MLISLLSPAENKYGLMVARLAMPHTPVVPEPRSPVTQAAEKAYRAVIASVMKHLHLLSKAKLNHSRNY